jgi:N-dimethylarginine dimethylaminohydrolase
MTPIAGLPDMVFAANGAKAMDGRVMVARFRHAERFAEAAAYVAWFRKHGYDHARTAEHVAEGDGDYLSPVRGSGRDRLSH